ncbi:hypothetical protein DSO57_1009163, partial [Entomophthora muscae]
FPLVVGSACKNPAHMILENDGLAAQAWIPESDLGGLLVQLGDPRADALHPCMLCSLNWLCQCNLSIEFSSPVSFPSSLLIALTQFFDLWGQLQLWCTTGAL